MTTPGQGPEYQVPIPWDAVEWDGQGPNVGSLNTVLQNLQAQILGIGSSGGTLPSATGKTLYAITPGVGPAYTLGWNQYLGWFIVATTLTSAGLTAAIAAAQALGNAIVLLMPGATYVFSAPIAISTAGNTPGQSLQITCFGSCDFDMSALAPGSVGIQWVGTPGPNTDCSISNVRFVGSSAGNGSYAIEVVGVLGFHVNRCRFTKWGTGVLWGNVGLNVFTENGIVEDCQFDSTTNCMEYLVAGGGATSFHGTGMRGSNLFTSTNETCCVVKIGAGAVPYQAPLEVLVFPGTGNGGCTVINNQSAFSASFKGWIKVETSDRKQCVSMANPGNVVFSGPVSCAGATWSLGSMTLCGDDFLLNLNGTTTLRSARDSVQIDNYPSATGIIGLAGTWRVTVAIQNSDRSYDYRYSFIAASDDFGAAGYVNDEAGTPLSNNDTHGYGPPTWTVSSNGVLVATQAGWPTAGITLYVDAQQLAQKLSYVRATGFARINDLYASTFLTADVTLNPTNTINLTAGMYFKNNNRVRFSQQSGTLTGLTNGAYYYVTNIVGTTLQLSDTVAGAAKVLTAASGGGIFQLFTY